jgi:hypothetical protein
MKKILIIGDSFVDYPMSENNLNERHVKQTWVRSMLENIKNYNIVVDGQPSRDVQTILDKWILSIDKLNTEDILIICIPTFYRTRLPLIESKWYGQKYKNYNFINKFIGANSYQEDDLTIDSFNHSDFKLKTDMITMYQILNSTKSAITNHLDVINTLKKLTPCYTYLFSWDDILYDHEIEDKKILSNNIGEWETLDDEFKNSNGEKGIFADLHWSQKMHELFYNYIINNKLKNFNL